VRQRRPALRQPHARRPALPDRARAAPRPVRPPGRRHGRRRRGRLAGQGRRGAQADRRGSLRRRQRDRARVRARGHDSLRRPGAARPRSPAGPHLHLNGAQHAVRPGPLRPLPARADDDLPRRARVPLRPARAPDGGARAVSMARKPTLAVWKFASCDGCQLSLLDCEDEILSLAGEVDIAYFLEATRATAEGPYDLSLVEGSVTTHHDMERIREVRKVSKALVTIGACATAGGVQALKNFADVDEYVSVVYATPDYISTLDSSTPISAHVPVDFELNGCPINKRQLLEVITAFLHGRRPEIPTSSVCMECKRRGTVCVMVAHGTPCLGPVTHAGCGALCPSYNRGCYGCFGPMETPNMPALTNQLSELGMSEKAVDRVFRTFNVRPFE